MTATIARLRSTLALQMALDSKRRAARLTELRENARLTQKALEEKSGVSERTIQRAENPDDDIELRYSTREKLAKALGVKPEALLAEANEPKGETPDLMGTVNGGPPDDLQQRLDQLEEMLNGIADAISGLSTQLEATSELSATRFESLHAELGKLRRRAA